MNDSRRHDNSEARKQNTNRDEPEDAKAAYSAKQANQIKEDPAKFESQLARAKARAAGDQHKDASPKTAPAPESQTQGQDNAYDYGMSQ